MIHRSLWTLFWRASQRGLVPDEEFPLVRTKITPPPSWMPARISQPRLAALAALALVAVLVVAATIGQEVRLLGAKTTTSAVAATATATATPQPTPTPTFAPLPSTQPYGQGWVKMVGLNYAAAVALAPGQPATLYACGSQLDPRQQDPHPYLGVSHDGGRTWQTSTLPAYCASLEVSPANAQDLAFWGDTCVGFSGCAAEGVKNWAYVSADGGKHWTQAMLPPNASGTPPSLGYLVAWAGTTLFVAPANVEFLPPDVHSLAASTNGGPFVWVDQNGLRDLVPNNTVLSKLTSVGNTLFVNFGQADCVSLPSQQCGTVATTADGGATWSHIRPTYQGEDLQIIGGAIMGGAADGTLLALPAPDFNSPTRALLRSTDGGATWTALPVFPGGARPSRDNTFALPDGTTIAQGDFQSLVIYKLSTGATAWVYIASPPAGDRTAFDAVSWDAGGHPLALWGVSQTSPSGVYSHPT